jgi:hypothetical protein
MSRRHRYDSIGCGSFGGNFYESGGGSRSFAQMGRQSDAQLEYMNNPNNFSKNTYDCVQKSLALAREANAQGNFGKEAQLDRDLQEKLKKKGVKINDADSREAFAWNSTWIHNPTLIAEMYSNNRTFDDSFSYDKKDGRYYLTPDALQWTKDNDITDLYEDKGMANIVKPSGGNGFSRNMSRSDGFSQSGGGFSQSGGGSHSQSGGGHSHSARHRYSDIGNHHSQFSTYSNMTQFLCHPNMNQFNNHPNMDQFCHPNMAQFDNHPNTIQPISRPIQPYNVSEKDTGRTFAYNHQTTKLSATGHIGIEVAGNSTPLQASYVPPPDKTQEGYTIRKDGYVSHPTKQSYHYQTGKTYNSNLPSNQQGHAVNPNEPVYYSMDCDLSTGQRYQSTNVSNQSASVYNQNGGQSASGYKPPPSNCSQNERDRRSIYDQLRIPT